MSGYNDMLRVCWVIEGKRGILIVMIIVCCDGMRFGNYSYTCSKLFEGM